ncbi:MAG: hypothetical protein ACLQDV_30710 [Candidatus Binataceae bacterium]
MKRPTLKTPGFVLRLLRVAGSNPSGSAAKSCIERTLRPKIGGPFAIENYQVLKSGYAMTLAGAQTRDIYEITARYAIAQHFSGRPIDEDALVRMGCTRRNRNGGRFFIYHCMTTIEFRKTGNRWKAIALRAPCAFYLGR